MCSCRSVSRSPHRATSHSNNISHCHGHLSPVEYRAAPPAPHAMRHCYGHLSPAEYRAASPAPHAMRHCHGHLSPAEYRGAPSSPHAMRHCHGHMSPVEYRAAPPAPVPCAIAMATCRLRSIMGHLPLPMISAGKDKKIHVTGIFLALSV